MSISITGPAAAFATVAQSGGVYQLKLTQDAATVGSGSYAYSLVETNPGYANSPNTGLSGLLVVQGSTDPILRDNLTPVSDRTAVLTRVPTAVAAGKQFYYPGDVSRWWVDASSFLSDSEPLGTATIVPSAAALALGITVDSGSRRMVISQSSKLIEFGLLCSASDLTPFASSPQVTLNVILTTAEALPSTYHKSITVTCKVDI